MGWLLGHIFFSYYQLGDTINYFEDATQLAQLAYQRPVDYWRVLVGWEASPGSLLFVNQPRALFFAKLVSVVNVFTNNNYWISSAYFSLLSFWASWLLANYLSGRFPRYRYAAVIAFLFYPSVVFWGSGILKESLAVTTILLIIYLTLRLVAQDYSQKRLVIFLLGLGLSAWLLWAVKYYYAAVLLPTLFSVGVARWASLSEKLKTMLPVFLLSWIMLVALVSQLHPNLSLGSLARVLVHNHDAIVRLSEPSNTIHFRSLDGSLGSFLLNVPQAVVSGLFRPLAGEGSTLLQWIAGLENTMLLLLFVVAFRYGWQLTIRGTNVLWVVAAATYVVLLAGLLAFASPNFGSLVRYKVSFLPIFVYLCLVGSYPLIARIRGKKSGK